MASDTQGRRPAEAKSEKTLGRDPEGRMSLGEHLVELRNRLVISAITVLLLSIVGWFLFPWVFEAVKAPIETAGEDNDLQSLINFQGVGQGLNVKLQMAAYIGLILSSPMLILQIWLFVMPGLHRNERRYAFGFFGSAIPLFFLGCVAGYWAVNQLVPVLMSFTPTEGSVSQIIPYDQYLALLIKTMLAFGIAFVVPVVMVLLNFMGLVSGRSMLKAWRWIVFLSFAFTAVMVPTPEPFTLIAMSAAIASLFFGAIVIALLHDRRVGRRAGNEDLADDEASRIDDDVEKVDGPSRLDEDADEDGR
ncbi:MAG: twin-arginine translocase subunit TatC [Brachybacterium sp.]|nr:twin-arginine translocase subunit TatC [Brachybacterium sp.]